MNGKLHWNRLNLFEFPGATIQLYMPITLYGWTDINNPILCQHMLFAIRKQLDKQGLYWHDPVSLAHFNWRLINHRDSSNFTHTTFTLYVGDPRLVREYHQAFSTKN